MTVDDVDGDFVTFMCHHAYHRRQSYGGGLQWCYGCRSYRVVEDEAEWWRPVVRKHLPDGPMFALTGELVAFHWLRRG